MAKREEEMRDYVFGLATKDWYVNCEWNKEEMIWEVEANKYIMVVSEKSIPYHMVNAVKEISKIPEGLKVQEMGISIEREDERLHAYITLEPIKEKEAETDGQE